MKIDSKIHIQYVSTVCSQRVLKNIFDSSIVKPGLAVQKFHRLILEGLSSHKDIQVKTLSSLPIIPSSNDRLVWNLKSEIVKDIQFNYIPIVNLPVLKNLIVAIYTFIKIFATNLFRNRNKNVVICDVLNLSITVSAVLACKLSNSKVIALVTDLPSLMVSSSSKRITICTNLISQFISVFDGYILLTEQMNEVVNPRKRPHIVMEGLVDINMASSVNSLRIKATERIILYAGGIYEKYGVKKLIDAFMLLDDETLRLVIFGSGEMEKDMDSYMLLDNRIIYKGVVHNDEVVRMELEATLLVNPRPTNEEFTKYSFPSKNMEYMVSGTPLLTTLLPGMPSEYYPYVYHFADESITGMAHTLKDILAIEKTELNCFGNKAKLFVLNEKNNIKQANRIINFLSKL